MPTIDTYRMLRALVDELARCGMTDACTSPGSRNTPLLLSLAREPRIRCWSHIDERSAGYFALGAAKAARGRPVAITCTSGTAAANLVPAVVEARWGRVPLIVLTADRPAELRDVGAGQAIDQLKLFGDAIAWFAELELPASADAAAMRWIRQLACRAYWTAADAPPGVVHLNVPLREPLTLDAPLAPEADHPGRPDGEPWVRRDRPPRTVPGATLSPAPRTVIVAGGPDRGRALADEAQRLGVPLLADPLSGARRGPAAIAHYDLLLRDSATARRLAPELVYRVGDLPTSKPLRAWLAALDARQVALDPDGAWQDPDATLALSLDVDPVLALRAAAPPAAPDPGWLAAWRDADAAVAEAIERTLGRATDATGETDETDESDALSEPAVARHLTAALPGGALLYVASSMPIRDVEEFSAVADDGPTVLSNRGANGIDGTVSAALGAAAARTADPDAGPVVLLIGDVALAHDLGGLLAARRHELALTIVCIDNDGGGIFHFLAVSGEQDAFEQHVATPHGLDVAQVAALYGLAHRRAQTTVEFDAALAESIASRRSSIVEVRTDRARNRELHARIADAATAALSRSAPAASPRA